MVFEHDLYHRICDGAASEARHDRGRRGRTASISRGPMAMGRSEFEIELEELQSPTPT
jgi:hypothetical protein